MTVERHPTSDDSPGAPTSRDRDPGARAWLAWARTNPLLAGAVLVFCVGALAALLVSLPPGLLRSPTQGPVRGTARPRPTVETTTSAGGSGAWQPETPPADASPGPWVDGGAPSPSSSRGLSLVYRYRTLPPGGDSRFDWVVQIRGERATLDGVDLVTWHMDPPPKNEGELLSRDRAGDGFPLFGDGPGGWFGVSATVRFRDGTAETLSRRVELPEPS